MYGKYRLNFSFSIMKNKPACRELIISRQSLYVKLRDKIHFSYKYPPLGERKVSGENEVCQRLF